MSSTSSVGGISIFFLGAFGINIAEIHTDTPTIFIYSFPVFRRVGAIGSLNTSDYALIALIGTIVAGHVLTRLFSVVQSYALVFRKDRARRCFRGMLIVPRLVVSVGGLWAKAAVGAALLIVVASDVVPTIEKAALNAADKVWEGRATFTLPVLPATTAFTDVRQQYDACSSAQALTLIYSDDSAYYELCRNNENSTQGVVFEVRRAGGLASMRFVARGGPLWPNSGRSKLQP